MTGMGKTCKKIERRQRTLLRQIAIEHTRIAAAQTRLDALRSELINLAPDELSAHLASRVTAIRERAQVSQ